MHLPSAPPSFSFPYFPSSSTTTAPALALVLLAALSDFALTRIALYGTQLLLLLPLATYALLWAGGRVAGRRGGGGQVGEEEGRKRMDGKSWTAAGLLVGAVVLRMHAARWNRSWVWTGFKTLVPLLISFLHPPFRLTPSVSPFVSLNSDAEVPRTPIFALDPPSDDNDEEEGTAPSASSSSAASSSPRPSCPPSPSSSSFPSPSRSLTVFALPTLTGLALLFLTDLASVSGFFLALASVGAEVGAWWAVRRVLVADVEGHEVEMVDGRTGGMELAGIAWRALLIHLFFYLFFHAFNLHDNGFTHVGVLDVLTLIAWPILLAGAIGLLFFLSSSLFARSNAEDNDHSSQLDATTLLAGKNALFLVFISSTGQEVSATSFARFVLCTINLGAIVAPLYSRYKEEKYPGLGGSGWIQLPMVGGGSTPGSRGKMAASVSSSSESGTLDSSSDVESLSSFSSRSHSFTDRRSTLPVPLLAFLTLLPFTLFFLTLLIPPCTLTSTCPTFDIVISHYAVPLSSVASMIQFLETFPLLATRGTEVRVVLYHKGVLREEELWEGMEGVLSRERGDSVVLLPNYGREGSTYLRHILSRLPSSSSSATSSPILATHTLFLQDHLAFSYSLSHRLSLSLTRQTSFLNLGPNLSLDGCGEDSRGVGGYIGARWIRKVLRGGWKGEEREEGRCDLGEEEKEGDRKAAAWSAQMVVGRESVERNGREVYEELLSLIEAPDGAPIHHKLWNPSGESTQSNPAFGHSLERSWPVVFHCDDPRIEEWCTDESQQADRCGCRA
ncbi:hypothetical protein JCM8547_005152 [Rhodosporidiobolus lusitaniae]